MSIFAYAVLTNTELFCSSSSLLACLCLVCWFGKSLEGLVHTFFDIEVGGVPKGRIVFAVYDDVCPITAENFRALCTGEKGTVPMGEGRMGEGLTYWFKDRIFHRIVYGFINQIGAQTESIYGGKFKDEKYCLKTFKHDRPGLLSMANWGPDSNAASFSIMMQPNPYMNGKYVIFGEIVKGLDIATEINSYAKGNTDDSLLDEDAEALAAKVVNAGQCKTRECKD